MSFKINFKSEHLRHQKYIEYEISSLQDYYELITDFITDKNISYENNDDIEFMDYLLYKGPISDIYISYLEFLLSQKIHASIIANYMNFQYRSYAPRIVNFIYLLLAEYELSIVNNIIDNMDSNIKTELCLKGYHFCKQIPCLKQYLVFS